jgi:hypothetical protein
VQLLQELWHLVHTTEEELLGMVEMEMVEVEMAEVVLMAGRIGT